jgi:RNA polymerase sigma-70 factor, ECF subfamily
MAKTLKTDKVYTSQKNKSDRSESEIPMDEQYFIQKAKDGDLEAFNQLVLNYQDIVYRQACYWVKDLDKAADITQDVFVKSFTNLSSFRGGSFKAWLLRIMTNTALDELRRNKRHPMIPLLPYDSEDEEVESPSWLTDHSASPEEIAEQRVLSQDVQQALNRLPASYRTIINLVDIEGLDYREAAQALGAPIGTIKSRLARARLLLRDRLIGASTRLPVNSGYYEYSRMMI